MFFELKMLRKLNFFFLSCFPSFFLCGQQNYFNKTYDNFNKNDLISNFIVDSDSNIVCVGLSIDFNTSGLSGYYFLKTDLNGDKINEKDSIYLYKNAGIEKILETSDRRYIMGGTLTDVDSIQQIFTNRDLTLIKSDRDGNVLWQKNYGETIGTASQPDYEIGLGLSQTKEGNFLIAGYTKPSLSISSQAYIVKIDSLGNKLWAKKFGGTNSDAIGAMYIDTIENIYGVGMTKSVGAGEADIYFVKLDSAGNLLWEKTYGGLYNDYVGSGSSLYHTRDGGFLFCGSQVISKSPYQYDAIIIRTDSNGNLLWQKNYGGARGDQLESIIELEDGSIVAVGSTASCTTSNYFHGWILKMDANGNVIWERCDYYVSPVGNYDLSQFYDVKPLSNGGFVVGGFAQDSLTKQNIWLVKMDCLGCDSLYCYYPDSCSNIVAVPELTPKNEEVSFKLMPNPANTLVIFEWNLPKQEANKSLEIYISNMLGQVVERLKSSNAVDRLSADLSHCIPGVYQCTMLVNGNKTSTQKLIVTK